MPLFHVQDSDRPAWVYAKDYGEAVQKWQAAIALENEGEADLPAGVALVCEDGDIIMGTSGFVEPLLPPVVPVKPAMPQVVTDDSGGHVEPPGVK